MLVRDFFFLFDQVEISVKVLLRPKLEMHPILFHVLIHLSTMNIVHLRMKNKKTITAQAVCMK